MMGDELAFMPVREMAPLIAARRVSPVEVVEAQLRRVGEMDEVLRAYIHVDAEGAMEVARVAEREIVAGRYRGPLHGVTVAHKDIIDVRGMPTTAATKAIPAWTPGGDATVAGRLREAGTVALGKLNLIEFASGSMGVFGFARNPWNLGAFPGGSSSGSGVALAAGMVTLATGTDTGGSVRNPASFCGVAGLRVTYGRVSRSGCVPLSWSQDSIGPMGRTVSDAAFMLGAMAGADPRDPTAPEREVPDYTEGLDRGVRGMRVGVPDSYFFDDLNPEVAEATRAAVRAFESLGAEVVPVRLAASAFAGAASWVIAYTESFVYHREWFETRSAEYTPAFYHKIAAAGLTSAAERIVAQQVRQVVTREFNEALKTVDVILTPTSRTLASEDGGAWGGQALRWSGEMSSVTRPVSLAGLPALSVPMGFAKDGTPMGLQIVGRAWDEATVLRAGHAYEQSADWHTRRPPAFPEVIPPRFGANGSPGAAPVSGGVDGGWVLGMAKLLGYGFVTEADAEAMAPMLGPVKEQLEAARRELRLDVEPPTRPAGLA